MSLLSDPVSDLFSDAASHPAAARGPSAGTGARAVTDPDAASDAASDPRPVVGFGTDTGTGTGTGPGTNPGTSTCGGPNADRRGGTATDAAPDHGTERRAGGDYRVLLGLPGARALLGAGLLGRLPMSMLGLGSLLLIADVTGSYGQAGAVSAALALAGAASGPMISRLIDRVGPRSVLLTLSVLHVLAGAGFLTVVLLGAPLAVMIAAAVATGATLPQVGAVARQRWTTLLADDPRLVPAYALESVADEVAFVVGPAAAGLLAGLLPATGVLAALLFAAVGVPLFAILPPPRADRPDGADPDGVHGADPAGAAGAAGADRPHRGDQHRAGQHRGDEHPGGRVRAGSVARIAGMPPLIGAFIGVGGFFGASEVTLVAVGREHGWGSAAGALPVLLTVTSLLSGLAYGAWLAKGEAARRFGPAAAALAVAAALIPLAGGLPLLLLGTALVGIPLAPVLILGNALVGAWVPAERRTEGFTWLAIATSVGLSISSPISGAIVDAAGAHRATLAIPVAAAVAAASALLATRHRARTRQTPGYAG